MAGDWIKMRIDLGTSPKVVRMSSALRADRLRIVGGLHAVWCLFDVHSEDGRLDGYTLESLDNLIGFEGFSAAMVAVGWLEVSDDSLRTPRFDEHNGKSAKRRASDTERKRVVRKVSAPDADKKRTREEKRREEKSIEPNGSMNTYPPEFEKVRESDPQKSGASATFVLPDWIPSEAWDAFMDSRKKLKAKDTDYAKRLIVKALEGFKAKGFDCGEIIDTSIRSGWKDVYEPKKTAAPAKRTIHDLSTMDYTKGVKPDGTF